jgi:tetratricopeptide (TPR) repeat protein
MILTLRDRQLVRRDIVGGRAFWAVHRALQLNMLHKLDADPNLRQCVFEQVLSVLRKVYPRQSDIQAPSNEHWRDEEECLPHVLNLQIVFEQSKPPMLGTPVFAELLGDVGNYLWERALYTKGIQCLELAAKLYDENSWKDSMAHSKVLTILGAISSEVGITGRRRATERWVRSLHLRHEHNLSVQAPSKAESLLLANAWNDMACGMLDYGHYGLAEKFLNRSVEIKRTIPLDEEGMAHFNYAENFKNLAIVRIAQRRTKAACKLTARAVHLIENGAGADTATTQAFKFHHAYAIYADGDLDEAYRLHEEVRKARRAIFGEDEVHSLNSGYACSVLLQALGKFDEAR